MKRLRGQRNAVFDNGCRVWPSRRTFDKVLRGPRISLGSSSQRQTAHSCYTYVYVTLLVTVTLISFVCTLSHSVA